MVLLSVLVIVSPICLHDFRQPDAYQFCIFRWPRLIADNGIIWSDNNDTLDKGPTIIFMQTPVLCVVSMR
jgi:hypothetical protein